MRWYRYHTQVGSRLRWGFFRYIKLSSDQVCSFGVQMLVEYDLVHSLCKVDVHLVQESRCVR